MAVLHRRRMGWMASVPFLMSCGTEVLPFGMPSLPADITHVAVLVEDESQQTLQRATGILPLGDDGKLRVSSLDPASSDVVRVLGYTAGDLDVLSPLPGGSVRLAEPELPLLPRATWSVVGSASGSLLDTTDPIPLSADFLGKCAQPCDINPVAGATAITVSPTQEGGVSFATATPDPARAFVVTAAGNAYWVDREGAEPLGPISDTPLGLTEGHTFADGTTWILSQQGIVFEGRAGGPFTQTTSIARLNSPVVAGPPVTDLSAPKELFITSSLGVFYRFDGHTAQRLFEVPPRPETDDYRTSIAWIGPGESAVTYSEAHLVVWARGSEIEVINAVEGPRGVAMVPGIGLVVGSDAELAREGRARLLVRKGTEFVELSTERDLGSSPRRIWPMGPGFFFGGIRGFLAYHRKGIGGCAADRLGSESIDDLVPLGPRFLLLAGRVADLRKGALSMTLLELNWAKTDTPECHGRD